jgi:hypothetical protein
MPALTEKDSDYCSVAALICQMGQASRDVAGEIHLVDRVLRERDPGPGLPLRMFMAQVEHLQ